MLKMKITAEEIETVGAAAEFYSEVSDGSYELQVDGAKSQGDVDRLSRALENERSSHRETKTRYDWVGDLDRDEVQSLRDAKEDLTFQLEKAPKMGEDEVEARAEKLANRATRKLEAQISELTATNSAHADAITLHEAAAGQRSIKDAVDASLQGEGSLKLVDGALEDVRPYAERVMTVVDGRVVSREGVEGVEAGLPFADVLADIQASGRRKHWFPASTGAGAAGGKGGENLGNNPFAEGSRNMTEIGKIVQNDPAKARALAKAAGENPARYGL